MGIRKAIGLLSGGLDSLLAIKLLQEQGIKVTAISFETPFFDASKARKAALQLKVPLIIKDITRPYLKMLKNPKYGYGKAINPCNDCHALMIRVAGGLMKKKGYDFIFTGEVLGERPFSQNPASLRAVANTSGYKDYLLRPLSAKLLDITNPEKEGIVDRDRLLDIQGRSRKRQFELVKKYGIKEYETPAGGCLLTDVNFARKVKDVFEHRAKPSIREYELLRVGRHLRLSKDVKLILGRNEKENKLLRKYYRNNDILVSAEHLPGPACLLVGKKLRSFVTKACGICAAYSDAKDADRVRIYIKTGKAKLSKLVFVNKQIKEGIPWI